MNSNEVFNNFNEIRLKNKNHRISFIHMNIRSLRKNFVPLLSHINNALNYIQLMILTETNINEDETQFFNIQGFNSIFLNRNGRGGGLPYI